MKESRSMMMSVSFCSAALCLVVAGKYLIVMLVALAQDRRMFIAEEGIEFFCVIVPILLVPFALSVVTGLFARPRRMLCLCVAMGFPVIVSMYWLIGEA